MSMSPEDVRVYNKFFSTLSSELTGEGKDVVCSVFNKTRDRIRTQLLNYIDMGDVTVNMGDVMDLVRTLVFADRISGTLGCPIVKKK